MDLKNKIGHYLLAINPLSSFSVQASGEMKFNYNLINFDKIIIPRGNWNNLEELIQLVISGKQETIVYQKQSELTNRSYQSDYESYLGDLSRETKYIQ
jgi:hypothetical protein